MVDSYHGIRNLVEMFRKQLRKRRWFLEKTEVLDQRQRQTWSLHITRANINGLDIDASMELRRALDAWEKRSAKSHEVLGRIMKEVEKINAQNAECEV